MTTLTGVKTELLKKEMLELLEEFARSYNVKLDTRFDEGFGKNVFSLSIYASMAAEGSVEEINSTYQTYESNWNSASWKWNLDANLLGKTIEVVGKWGPTKYKILGLNSTSKRVRYCVAVRDMRTGDIRRAAASMVKSAKLVPEE